MNKDFSKQAVDKLNEQQKNPRFHPYTCNGQPSVCLRQKAYQQRREDMEIPFTDENEGILRATENGWVCPCGEYVQDWYH